MTTISNDPKSISDALTKMQVGAPQNALSRAQFMAGLPEAERRGFTSYVLNATTINIDAALKRVAILNGDPIRAFAARMLPLALFATSFSNVPLQGTDEVAVHYFPLQAGASTDWNGANGYVFAGTSNQQMRKITVDKRKYQAVDYGSDTLARQPAFNAVMLARMNAEKLAADILTDVLSVVTAANYGAAVLTAAPAAMTSDDIVDIMGACNDAHWPDGGRGLIVDSSVNTSLQKDSAFKLALNIGGTEVIRQGKLPTISGFEFGWIPNLPDNGEKLIGFASFMSAILAAFAPVEPSPEVRSALSAYEIVTDSATGISMNYRAWGDPDLDRSKQIIESAYGYQAGEAAALKRICSP